MKNSRIPIELSVQLEEIGEEIRKILKINPEEIIELKSFIDKVEENFNMTFEKNKYNYISFNNGNLIIFYDYYSDKSKYYQEHFIIKAFCYAILNEAKLENNCILCENVITSDKYTEYLSNSVLLPKKLYLKEMIETSRVDGCANIEGMAKKFKVKENTILSRGKALYIWN